MLAVMLVVSIFTLIAVNVMFWKPRDAKGSFSLLELLVVIAIVSILCGLMLNATLLWQVIASAVGSLGVLVPRYGRQIASVVSVSAFLVVWTMAANRVSDYRRDVDTLREATPFVSLEERLPIPKSTTVPPDLQIETIERQVGFEHGPSPWNFRHLHDERTKDFINTPGFGVGRMVRTPLMLQSIRRAIRVTEPIPQPGILHDDIDPTGDAVPDAKVRDFFNFHAGSIGSFVNFKGFGYLKSRREVAGFTPHAFESEPKPQVPYKLERLELVGLVRNPEPAVYVSEFLPRMTELDAVTTRPADGFEATALTKLAAGEDLVANAVGSKVRLLGAVRNMTACVECHGGQRGDLLGAFSYRLAEAK